MPESKGSSRIERFLQRRIKRGRLTLRLGSGAPMSFGDGSGPEIAVTIERAGMLRLLRDRSSLGVGECYMDGMLRMDRGEIYDLVDLVGRNSRFGPVKETWLRRILRDIRQRNAALAARRNAAHHYDLSVDLYRRFLDADFGTFSVEIDGGFHVKPLNYWDDARRHNDLLLVGQRILRFPSVAFRLEPEVVVAQLRAAKALFG